jgi:hypothetical protein
MSVDATAALDKATVESIAALYPMTADEAQLFSNDFRRPFLARGYLTREELAAIVTWKSGRHKTNILKNSADTVAVVTRQAFACPEPWLAAWILQYLYAVRARVASAILTVFDPNRYTVMDVRAWSALERLGLLETLGLAQYGGVETADLDSQETYAAYLHACKRLSREMQVSLRTLDRCLWTLDKLGPAGLVQRGITL